MKKTVLLLFISTIIFGSCQGQREGKGASCEDLTSFIKSDDIEAFRKNFSDTTDVDHFIVDKSDNKSYTLLGFACKYKKENFLEELLQRKADINLAKSDGVYEYDALYVAIEAANDKAAKLLLERGAKANSNYTEEGLSPLALSCNFNNVETVKILLANKASVDGSDTGEGRVFIPLVTAVNNNFKDIVKVLVDAGADPNLKNAEGVSALSLAQSRNNKELARLLLSNPSEKTNGNSKITAVVFQKEDYTLMVKTENKTYSVENLEFSGYTFQEASLESDGTIKLRFSHSSGSQIFGFAKSDTSQETLILTRLEFLSTEKNDESGKLKKCEITGLSKNFEDADEEELFDQLTSNCS